MVRRRRAISAVAAAAALCSADAREARRPAAARGRPAPSRSPQGSTRKSRRRNKRRTGNGIEAGGRPAVGPEMGASSHLTTAFSCGSVWTRANTCGILCPTGRDDACPDGEACYAGMDCAASDRDADGVLSEQRAMEQSELNRLAEEGRDETHVDRFVCGASYDDAALRCSTGADPPQLGRGRRDAGAHYCPSGSSGSCPAGTECYAAVPCPGSTHAPEVPALVGAGPGGDGDWAGHRGSPLRIAVGGVTEAVPPAAGNRTEEGAGEVGRADDVRPPEPSPPAGFWATALSGLVGPC